MVNRHCCISQNLGSEMVSETDKNSYSQIKRLSDDALTELWHEYFADRKNKSVRDKLIIQYIYLTKFVLSRVRGTLPPSFSMEDIASYGIEGLIDAIEKYSPDKGARFETYALFRIRGNIIDKIRSQDFLPRSARKRIKDVKNATDELKAQIGRMPTTTEIAKHMGLEKNQIDEILAEDTSLLSIYDKKGTTEDSVEIIETVKDENKLTPEEQLEEKDVQKELHEALKRLPERERMIMVLYYHENMTLKDIGDMIEVSESRVCQLHAQAIMKLRKILSQERTNRLKQSIV